MQDQPYRTPSTTSAPTSLLTYRSSFNDQYPDHSKAGSTYYSYDHRPPSPALSHISSPPNIGPKDSPNVPRDSINGDSTPPVRPKTKKAKLDNITRKAICIYQQDNPHLKQEDIGRHFKLDRSTVSKILKGKYIWLNIEDGIVEVPRHR